MKLVTFAGAMAPYVAGEKRLVPDALAGELEAQGALTASEAWPPHARTPAAVAPRRPVISVRRPSGAPDSRKASPRIPT